MKIFSIILFITLVIYIQNLCTKFSDATRSECKERENIVGSYCCFLHTKNGNDELKQCFPYTQNQYDNIEETIKSIESATSFKVVSLYCKSSYLQMGLLGLLFFLL